jgi:hypothetical protein
VHRLNSRVAILLVLSLAPASSGGESSPADTVLRLVPNDAGAVLVVTDLRGHTRQLLDSPLAEGLRRLPAVTAWLATDQARQLKQSCRDIEAVLGMSLATFRDELLGDAAALCLRLPEGADPELSEGMLLTRFRDRTLLDRLIARINEAELRNGTLVKVVERQYRSVSYSIRSFQPGTRPDDVFAVIGDGVFVWSNAQDLVRSAIDRQIEGGGLLADPRFEKVRAALPSQPLASIYVDPRFLTRIAAASTGTEPPTDDAGERLIRRYFDAIEYLGAAIEWRDGLILQVHESLDPAKLDEPLRRWAARSGGASALLGRVPPTAPVLAAGNADFTALGDLAMGLVPEMDRGRAENVLTMLRGIFLGLDIREKVLPRIGPGILAYIDAPVGGSSRWPLVLAMELGGSPEDSPSIASAVDNALRTVLALASLDAKASAIGARVSSQELRGVRVTSLDGGSVAVSYAIGPRFVAVGTTPEAVAGFAADPPAGGNPTLERLRTEYFPASETYLAADLESLHRLAGTHREALLARLAAGRGGDEAAARRDLDGVLALVRLFRAAFATSRLEPDATAAHRTLGLIVRETSRP